MKGRGEKQRRMGCQMAMTLEGIIVGLSRPLDSENEEGPSFLVCMCVVIIKGFPFVSFSVN